jgi:multimeric flavodoxin WrbA/putative sterol carrier protein
MKGLAATLPHIVITLYITLVSMAVFPPVRLGAVSFAGLLLMGTVLYLSRKEGGVPPVGKGYLLCLMVNTVIYWVLPEQAGRFVSTNPTVILYGSLCAVVVAPALCAGQYFTEYFARKTTPLAVWQTDIFRCINRNMSWAWAGIFAVSVAIALIPDLLSMGGRPFPRLLIQMGLPMLLMVGVGVPFNKRYPAYYQRKMGVEPVAGSTPEDARHYRPAAPGNNESTKEKVMSNRFTVVAVNGSPHGGIGNTSMMIEMMKPILAQEGVDLEQILLADKHIEFCVGCGVCLEKGKCWRQDDHGEIIARILAADGVILASPVYFTHVTAQMKAFIDRSLAYGHKPRATWKPGMAISVSAGMAETATADYLANMLHVYGAFSTGALTAIATSPGGFLGMELVEARAKDLARDLARAIKEERRYPATDRDLFFYLFMGDLVKRERDFMRDDYRHWQESGFFEGFEAYIGQNFTTPPYDPELRKEWVREMIRNEVTKTKDVAKEDVQASSTVQSVSSCEELLRMMPRGFNKEAAGALHAVYQFEISGAETLTGHLNIADGHCVFVEGSHPKPDVIIKSPADVWLAISKGELNGQTAFMVGKYKVEGDLRLLMKLGSLFGS